MNPIITEMAVQDKYFKAYIQGNPGVCEYGPNETVAVCKLLLRLQGVKVITLNGFTAFAVVMWISWLALSWLIVLTDMRMDAVNGIMWGLFLFLGICGSALASKK